MLFETDVLCIFVGLFLFNYYYMRKLLTTFSLLAVTAVAFAVPAKRGVWKTVRLADGTEVKVELRGDEFGHFWQSQDLSLIHI